MTVRTGGRPPLIGLTGPIGCGKSTVAAMLAGLGGTVIDADDLARQATTPGEPALPPIRARFGDAVFAPDGSLDRAALAAVVFHDPAALADLERIIHPAVRARVEQLLAGAANDSARFVVIEAIKLVEGGLADRCDEVWLVDCSPLIQRRRLVARGTSPAEAERRILAQGDQLADRLAAILAERGIRGHRLRTDGSLADVGARVAGALSKVLLRAGRGADSGRI